jgi:ribosomal protein L37E
MTITNAPPTVSATCRHCGRSKVNRPRGLCWTCYYTPGVRESYHSGSKYAYRGVANITGNRPVPAQPTAAPPGTDEKLAVLAERAKSKVALWHPLDARYPGDPRPGGAVHTAA